MGVLLEMFVCHIISKSFIVETFFMWLKYLIFKHFQKKNI